MYPETSQINIHKLIGDRMSNIIKKEVGKNLTDFSNCLNYATLDGKKIRSQLLVASSEVFQGDLSKAVDCGCALEFIHGASLVLDDLPSMDNAEYRRNKKTLHKQFGEGTAILTSAALYTMAFNTISKIGHGKISQIIKDMTESIGSKGLIMGQYLDLNNTNGKKITLEELFNTYYLKTGVLFTVSLKVGAILGNATKQEISIIEKIGKTLGIAYQIKDDILDYGAFEDTGKDSRKDELNNKTTSVTLLGILGAKKEFQEQINFSYNLLELLQRDISPINKIIKNIENA